MLPINILKSSLGEFIEKELIEEFSPPNKYVSGNLRKTITLDINMNGDVTINIPAKIYNRSLYKKSGIISYTGQGSYASIVNSVTGGYSGSHTNFAMKRVSIAIIKWAKANNLNIKIGG